MGDHREGTFYVSRGPTASVELEIFSIINYIFVFLCGLLVMFIYKIRQHIFFLPWSNECLVLNFDGEGELVFPRVKPSRWLCKAK